MCLGGTVFAVMLVLTAYWGAPNLVTVLLLGVPWLLAASASLIGLFVTPRRNAAIGIAIAAASAAFFISATPTIPPQLD